MQQFQSIKNRRLSCGSESVGSIMANPVAGSIITLPVDSNLTLTADNTQIPTDPSFRQSWQHTERLPQYIFQGMGLPSSPSFGDVRTCYAVLPNNTLVTIFGNIKQNRLIPYIDRDNQILRIVPGSRSVAIDRLSHEYHTEKWSGRGGGFVLGLFGLSFICLPGAMFPSRIPGFRWVPEDNLLAYTFLLAVGHSIINVVTAFLFHSPIPAVAITVAILVYAAIRYQRYL